MTPAVAKRAEHSHIICLCNPFARSSLAADLDSLSSPLICALSSRISPVICARSSFISPVICALSSRRSPFEAKSSARALRWVSSLTITPVLSSSFSTRFIRLFHAVASVVTTVCGLIIYGYLTFSYMMNIILSLTHFCIPCDSLLSMRRPGGRDKC